MTKFDGNNFGKEISNIDKNTKDFDLSDSWIDSYKQSDIINGDKIVEDGWIDESSYTTNNNKNENFEKIIGNFTDQDKHAIEKGIELLGNDDFVSERTGSQWKNPETGELKPNIEYTTGENNYKYKTDEQGRIVHAEAKELKLKQHEGRLEHNSQSPDKLEGDNAGHIIGDQFGGSPDIDNIISQTENLNKGEYLKLEKYLRGRLDAGDKVETTYDLKYNGDSRRPSEITVSYRINGGDWQEQVFSNEPMKQGAV